MDSQELFLSCRKGDLSKVKYLVEQKEVEVNIRDKWDSTPLYYACLCGHTKVVQYLLANGARCEASTFDGERCLYGALHQEISRELLKNNAITTHTIRRDAFQEFMRRILSTGEFSDVTFAIRGRQFNVHRCILSARCEYFCDMFETKWKDRSLITINNDLVEPAAFSGILQYLYTGRMEIHMDIVSDCILLAVQCKLHDLKAQLEEMYNKITSFECMKPGISVKTLLIESPSSLFELQQDFGVMVKQALPVELSNWVVGSELPLMPSVPPAFVDLCIVIAQYRFLCHKVFLCGRSEYFKALANDPFSENAAAVYEDNSIITLRDISPNALEQILCYVYTNSTQLTLDTVCDILIASDMYFLVGLKRLCGLFLAEHIDTENIIGLIRRARLHDLPRLENQCTEFIAKNLEKIVNNKEFIQLVLEDADCIEKREETDSITVIDDIRYHITSAVQTYSEMSDAHDKLQLVDLLLEDLGLDA